VRLSSWSLQREELLLNETLEVIFICMLFCRLTQALSFEREAKSYVGSGNSEQ